MGMHLVKVFLNSRSSRLEHLFPGHSLIILVSLELFRLISTFLHCHTALNLNHIFGDHHLKLVIVKPSVNGIWQYSI